MRILKTTFLSFFLVCLSCIVAKAQENISLTGASISPTPFATVENYGHGCLSFTVFNVNIPGYDSASTELKVELSKIVPHFGVESVSSSLGDLTKYDWEYDVDSNILKAVQIAPIGALYFEDFTICFRVVENSSCDSIETVGFNSEAFVVQGDDGSTNDNFLSGYSCTSEDVSSIDESKVLDPNIKIYPNPSSGELNIESDFDIYTIELYNLLGQRVMDIRYDGNVIRLDKLNTGYYICRVLSKDQQLIGLKEINLIQF